ncbi:hypothetical protein CMO83_03540 [Candidatus Woesearchaeota archaeon]|jgi:hypothetical protein|nr:hypothetical protein [Candidatus Woesearchaeota archaeon]|tara:strand:+ start:943 stop:2151 length:1209 start_codon:yes stop_codon:yes gene_type:complete
MVRKKVVDYVKSLLQQGYDISSIRNTMLKYGYNNKDVDDAINEVYSPTIRHEIHLSSTTILAVVVIVAAVVGITLFFYFNPPKAPTQLLDLNLEPVKTEVQAGQSITFLKELSNLGSAERYDVVIKQEILDPNTYEIITEKTETRAIETFGSTTTNILIPKDTNPGDYILRAIIEYDNKKAVATLAIKIAESEGEESCSDGIKNQDEENVDCGGVCNPCEQQIECNDNDPCTNDLVESGQCVNSPITPCCGNNVCEEQEQGICALDCEEAAATTPETLEDIKELARSDPSEASKLCNNIQIPDLKDQCFSNIGEVQRNQNYCNRISNERTKDFCYKNVAIPKNDNSLCEEISTDAVRDTCYMTFVLDNDDFSVCGKITNDAQRRSCESLRQVYELNQEINQK